MPLTTSNVCPAPLGALIAEIEQLCADAPAKALARATALMAQMDGAIGPADRAAALRVRADAHKACGQLNEALTDLHDALALTPADDHPTRTDLWRRLAHCYHLQSSTEQELHSAQQAVASAEACGQPAVLADALYSLSSAHRHAGALDEAVRFCKLALAAAGPDGDRQRRCVYTAGLGLALLDSMLLEDAAQQFHTALGLAAGNRNVRATLLAYMGDAMWRQGKLAAAFGALSEATMHLAATGNLVFEADARVKLGRVLLAMGKSELARQSLERALALTADTTVHEPHADAHMVLSTLHRLAGRPDLAQTHLEAHQAAQRRMQADCKPQPAQHGSTATPADTQPAQQV